MAGKGRISPVWSEEMDRQLLTQVKAGKKMASICTTMKMCKELINRRLIELGFGTLRDARQTLIITREFDDKLLAQVAEGKRASEMGIYFSTSNDTIFRRLREMGFDGLKDARKVLCN